MTHARSAGIKSFATSMVRDHAAADDKLRTIAQRNGFTLAGTAMVEQTDLAKLDSLQALISTKPTPT